MKFPPNGVQGDKFVVDEDGVEVTYTYNNGSWAKSDSTRLSGETFLANAAWADPAPTNLNDATNRLATALHQLAGQKV